jgi:hypothetical protein
LDGAAPIFAFCIADAWGGGLIKQLAMLDFTDKAQNVVLISGLSIGKTHPATAW